MDEASGSIADLAREIGITDEQMAEARRELGSVIRGDGPDVPDTLRLRAGLDRGALAALVGLDEEMLGEIEGGRRDASAAELAELAGAVGVSQAAYGAAVAALRAMPRHPFLDRFEAGRVR